MKTTLPWRAEENVRCVYDSDNRFVCACADADNARILTAAANSLQPFLCIPRLVSERGLPKFSSVHTLSVYWFEASIRILPDGDSRCGGAVAWMPLPTIPCEDAFEKWWKDQLDDASERPNTKTIAKAAWNAALESKG